MGECLRPGQARKALKIGNMPVAAGKALKIGNKPVTSGECPKEWE
jgi:hypothetical protein